MTKRFTPISNKLEKIYHGGDYNPDQWLKYPEILEEDIRLMKLSKCNVMTIGIFSWITLEPEEGKYNFEWLDKILDRLYENEIYFILATPSGARPAWMSQKYPEILRVEQNGIRNLHGERHNHCFTSPIYREKVRNINTKLAERYSKHPGILAWHISNEYNGECHCDLCKEAFREWLRNKYKTLDNLNHSWWNSFWSHTITDWSQINPPSYRGEVHTHSMNLDWKRFVTDQTIDFCKEEIKPLKAINSELKVTTNFMSYEYSLDYWKFKDVLDIISWDSYPLWHDIQGDVYNAAKTALFHDFNRSVLDGQPFMLMESTPSMTNWQNVSKLKRPGMHILSSMQAIAHGSDTVQYFQWRKSRGASEKFHGAVVDHCGHENTRVFREVSKLGEILDKLDGVRGTSIKAEVGLIFDWDNRWAINDAQGPRNEGIKYEETVIDYYIPFWKKGVAIDVIEMNCDFSKYKVIVAPMLYMVKEGVAKRLEKFVKEGGILISTYLTGMVDENDLCFLNGFPGPLRKLLGIWNEEIDSLYDGETNNMVFLEDNYLKIQGEYEVKELCEIIHSEGAEVLATYKSDFYKGMPALTVNNFGNGKAYYIAARGEKELNDVFLGKVIEEEKIGKSLNINFPEGVMATKRECYEESYIFIMNFNNKKIILNLNENQYIDIVNNKNISNELHLDEFGFIVLKKL